MQLNKQRDLLSPKVLLALPFPRDPVEAVGKQDASLAKMVWHHLHIRMYLRRSLGILEKVPGTHQAAEIYTCLVQLEQGGLGSSGEVQSKVPEPRLGGEASLSQQADKDRGERGRFQGRPRSGSPNGAQVQGLHLGSFVVGFAVSSGRPW